MPVSGADWIERYRQSISQQSDDKKWVPLNPGQMSKPMAPIDEAVTLVALQRDVAALHGLTNQLTVAVEGLGNMISHLNGEVEKMSALAAKGQALQSATVIRCPQCDMACSVNSFDGDDYICKSCRRDMTAS